MRVMATQPAPSSTDIPWSEPVDVWVARGWAYLLAPVKPSRYKAMTFSQAQSAGLVLLTPAGISMFDLRIADLESRLGIRSRPAPDYYVG